jgi:hypothetical protein
LKCEIGYVVWAVFWNSSGVKAKLRGNRLCERNVRLRWLLPCQ